MNNQDLINKYAPFIGGVVTILVGTIAPSNVGWLITMLGVTFTAYGFYHMVRKPKS